MPTKTTNNLPGSEKKEPEKLYAAFNEDYGVASEDCYKGTLAEISIRMGGDEHWASDYAFYELGSRVEVEYKKEIFITKILTKNLLLKP
jgi:hypothetical protein